MKLRLGRAAAWLPTAVVLLVVLAAGGRLITLSVQERAQAARTAAQQLADRGAASIQEQLGELAAVAAGARSEVPAGFRAFRVSEEGFAQGADDTAAATQLLSEWRAARREPQATRPTLLGPVRLGSQWIIAAAAPRTDGGWAMAYVDLERLLTGANLSGITGRGFDFQVSQPQPAGERIFLGSRTEALEDPAHGGVRAPQLQAAAQQGEFLRVAVKPRDGWYPPGEIASAIGLLAVIAWLLAFGTHDLLHRVQRLRASLASSRVQLQVANARLLKEIEERHDLQRSFDHARYHDAFTGLPNRRYFMDQLDRALRELRTRKRQAVAVMLVDFDRFKLISETLGHTAADELMVQAARRFEKASASIGVVLSRWGDDQFAVLAPDVHSMEGAFAAATLLQDSLRGAFELRRHRLSIAARVGLTYVDSGLHGAEDVLREADIALSVARGREAARIVAYQPAMGGAASSLVSLEADLHIALERDELRLLFQPIVDLRGTPRIVGAEALLRWRHPVEGLLAPDKFLAIAEEAGLIVPITRWVIRRVCRLAADWQRRLPPGTDFYVSVNLSATVLRDPGLCEFVGAALAESKLAPRMLKFELAERGLIHDVGAKREVLDRLHGMGIQLMLDDFGTGYSSLNFLQLFPFDFVKIDRPFLKRGDAEPANDRIARALLQMASSLGLKAIAEIVETQLAARALQQMGCDFGQGYFFSEPLEAEEALRRMRAGPLPALGFGGPPPDAVATAPPRASSPLQDDSPTMLVEPLPDTDSLPLAEEVADDSPTLLVEPLPDTAPDAEPGQAAPRFPVKGWPRRAS